MKIQTIQTIQQNKSFTSKPDKKVVEFYHKLDPSFLKTAKVEGINKSAILEIIKRLYLYPRFEKLSFQEASHVLFQKILHVVAAVNTGKPVDELRRALLLPEIVVERLVKIREHRKFLAEILAHFNNGESVTEIAKEYNLSGQCIRKYLKECGFEFTRKTDFFDDEVISKIKSGKSDTEVVKEIGLSKNAVINIRKKNDLKANRKARGHKFENEILEKLNQGVARKNIAKEYGVSKATVDKIAEENNIFKTLTSQRNAEILEMLDKHIPIDEIAKHFKVSTSTINRVALEHGFTSHKRIVTRNEAIIEALKEKSVADVAKKFKLAERTIYNIKYGQKSTLA